MLDQLRDQLTVRLRTYEMSTAADDHRRVAGQRRRHGASGRHQDLGRRFAVDRQHRPVLPVSGHRRHAHHRRGARVVRACELHPRAAHRDRRGLLPEGLADGLPRAGRQGRRHHPRRLRGGTAQAPAHRPPAAARARRRDQGRTAAARPRSRRHVQPLRRPDPLLGRHHRRRPVRARTRITMDAMRFGASPPGCASRCTTTRR